MIRLVSTANHRRACQHCGGHVSSSFRRTFGDEDDVAHRCQGCDSAPRLQAGSAAGRDVSYPDPDEQPNRNRGSRVDARADGGESL
ncbi:hypothetical protein VB773_13185 [Haloarculaceae archaeon H-GB2-1]|nr:hypothetical protein [Haloarculaceae archaeon H-GB1-1]MEA5386918.1 hypothetical protein [Haloarculaceae archaeon H-GB11]MEA5408423.1 hypothetical protein [Haloarculaceae archaeon H-GB2-1]